MCTLITASIRVSRASPILAFDHNIKLASVTGTSIATEGGVRKAYFVLLITDLSNQAINKAVGVAYTLYHQ